MGVSSVLELSNALFHTFYPDVEKCRVQRYHQSLVVIPVKKSFSTLTALSILVCSLVCECGHGNAAASFTAFRSTLDHTTPLCHRSTLDNPPKAPTAPCHSDGNRPCGHCEQLATKCESVTAVDASLYQILNAQLLSTLHHSLCNLLPVRSHRDFSGASPPSDLSTLLRLHCSLIG